jgi:hypothetical protein
MFDQVMFPKLLSRQGYIIESLNGETLHLGDRRFGIIF